MKTQNSLIAIWITFLALMIISSCSTAASTTLGATSASKGSTTDMLSLAIVSDKNIYQAGDVVSVTFVLKNLGAGTVRVNNRMAILLRAEIFDSDQAGYV